MPFQTLRVDAAPTTPAPDGSEVKILCALSRGGMAAFTLAPGQVSKAVAHRSVEEIWYVIAGQGRLWRRLGEHQEIVDAVPGLCATIPTGTHFQFRCDGTEPLVVLGVTMPPWPGATEAYEVPGPWAPTQPHRP